MWLLGFFLAGIVLTVETQNPPYGNSSTLPLYRNSQKPEIEDIACCLSVDGWFEALMGALLPFMSTEVANALSDPEDGTVSITLDHKVFVADKAPWGNCSSGVAWPNALWTALKELLAKTDDKIEKSVQGLTGKKPQVTIDYSVPNDGTWNPYDQARLKPVLARLRKNATDSALADRYLHILPDSSSNGANLVFYGGISLNGSEGPTVETMNLNKWMENCDHLYLI